jgi:acetolactate synthase-1/2/3 large subunit
MEYLSGASIFFEALKDESVDVIFGYPGGAVIHLYDELAKRPDIRHILVRHEQAAVHAADGYARATGRPGVCLATSGPGATNLVTGLACAYMDSIPVVAFTGQVATGQLGNDAFQEVDIIGITRTCTKHNYMVRTTEELASIIKEAFWVASSGRPGPVLVDLPKDVLVGKAPYRKERFRIPRGYRIKHEDHPEKIRTAIEEMAKAKRPLIYAGGGIIHSRAHGELLALAEALRIPVTLTLLGLGGFPPEHPLYLGMLGMHGTVQANHAVSHCDLLIAIGCRFDDRVTGAIEAFAPHARIIHIDIDPSSISKNIDVELPIVGDAKRILSRMIREIKERSAQLDGLTMERQRWLTELEEIRHRHPLVYERHDGVIKPQYVIEQLCQLTRGQAIVATDVGQNQMWTAQFFKIKRPRQLLSSGGLGAMGYGLPAAIGAQVAFPDRVVLNIAGDGSIQMNIQELATAVQYHLPVKIAILNNRSLGMVRQWQELFFEARCSETLLEVQPDFVKLAEAYGATGIRATRPQEVAPCIERALSIPGPVLMEFLVDPREKVFPMVPPGKGIAEMILSDRHIEEPEGEATPTLPA